MPKNLKTMLLHIIDSVRHHRRRNSRYSRYTPHHLDTEEGCSAATSIDSTEDDVDKRPKTEARTNPSVDNAYPCSCNFPYWRKSSLIRRESATSLIGFSGRDSTESQLRPHKSLQGLSGRESPVSQLGSDQNRKRASGSPNVINCSSLASGWFLPEKGMVVICECTASPSIFQEKRHYATGHKNKGRAIHVSSEGLFNRLRSGEEGGITVNVQGRLLQEHDSILYYGSTEQLKLLEEGGAFYSFTCRTFMTLYERLMVKTLVNLSSFQDELAENFVPIFDADDPEDVLNYTFVLQKSAYLLPGVKLSAITPDVVSSTEYQQRCQPINGTKIWEQRNENTFRFTRPIIPYIYSITVQLKVSTIHGNDLDALSKLMGVRVDHAICKFVRVHVWSHSS